MKEQTLKYSNLTPLPNNFLAEQSILNILLTNPNLIKKALETLKIDSFYFEPNKILYSTLLKLEEQKKIVTITTVVGKLQDDALLNKIGGLNFIVDIINRFERFFDLE